MIVLDTHVWIWWVHGDPRLPGSHSALLTAAGPNHVGVSAISLWEAAMLVARNRVQVAAPLEQWFHQALTKSGVQVLPLTPEVAVETARLPGTIHRDPADRIIIATARVLTVPLVTLDGRILSYPHVQLAP